MTLVTDANSAGESILVIGNPYNSDTFEHPEISIKIEVTKPDGTYQELMDQKGVFNLGKLDTGTYNVQLFSVSTNPELIATGKNQSAPRIDSFEITDTTSAISPGNTSGAIPGTTPTTTPRGGSTTPTPTPSTPKRLGSTFGITAETKITGDFVLGFQTQERSVTTALSDTDTTKLRQELINLGYNWADVEVIVRKKFNPTKITDNDPLKEFATNITITLDELQPFIKTPADKFTPELTEKLATIIVAYNVEFPQKTVVVLPAAASATSIGDDKTAFKIDKEEEDRMALLEKDLKQLEGISNKTGRDVTGLITLLTQQVEEENVTNKKKLVLSQLQHAISDFENFKSRLEATGEIGVAEASGRKVEEMKKKAAALTEKDKIAMPPLWNAELFKPVQGIGKFKEYEAQLKKVNGIIDRQNDKRKEIIEAAASIDTNKLTNHFGRIDEIRAQVEDFDKKLEAIRQQLSTTNDPKQLAPLFTRLGSELQKEYKIIKDIREKIISFEKDIFELIKSINKITRHKKRTRGITGWFEQTTHRNSGTLTEESKKLDDQREYLQNLLERAKEIATPTPTPVPTPVPAPPTITPEANIFPESPNVPLKETEILKTISINSDKLYGTFTRTESIGGSNKSPQQVLQELSKEGPIDITQITNIMKRMHSLRSKRIYKKDITNLRGDLIALERYLQPAYELLHNLHRTEKSTNKGKMDKTRTKGATTARANRIGDLIRQTRALMVQVNQYIKENS